VDNIKFKPRIDLIDRNRLENVLPLRTPYVIFIDPSDACNFKCSFCPTGDPGLMKTVGRPLKQMDWALYKKIIDDVCGFSDKVKVIRLYKDGEPLLNANFPKMVKYAKESGCCERVDTTTNASLLSDQLSAKIVEAGLDRINISIEGMNEKQYLDFSGYRIKSFDEIVEKVACFYTHSKGKCETIVKINGDALSQDQKDEFVATFGPISDGIWIESVMACWPEFELRDGVRVNQERGIYGQKIEEQDICPYPFYSISVNSDGQVSLCFIDWAKKLVIGDLSKESIIDVWSGKKLRDYRMMFLNRQRYDHDTCGSCGQLSHGCIDNIDEYAEYLKTLY